MNESYKYWSEKITNMRFSNEDAKKIFFTSDTHFNHEKIPGFCARPFKDIKEHDKELVYRWNAKVPADGLVFHLGDVCFGDYPYCEELLNRLNGNIFLVLGNHDMRDVRTRHKNHFIGMSLEALINVEGQDIILNHFPLLCYAGSYRKKPVWQLYGHVHTSPYSEGIDAKRLNGMTFPQQYDVGVDNNNFTPLSFAEVQQIIQTKIDQSQQERI